MPDPNQPSVPVQPLGVVVPPGALTASIRKAVETAVAENVPSGKRMAMVAVLDESGAKFGVAARLGDDWRLVGNVGTDWGGNVTGHVVLIGSM